MDTAETRQLVERFIAARAAGHSEGVAALLAPEVQWHPPVSAGLPVFVGRSAVVEALMGGAPGRYLDLRTIRRDVHRVIAEGGFAAVQQRLTARTHEGADYVNEYCWIYTCEGGAIIRLDEYADTLLAGRVFGWVDR
jgi:ketosteroid isomerase-like protein